MPYTPEHATETNGDSTAINKSPERDFETPEPRALDGMFTPDAPGTTMSKKVVTRFASDYGENVPEFAQEGKYTGPSIAAVVVKTFVPCYIVQMPSKVRAKIYTVSLLPLL